MASCTLVMSRFDDPTCGVGSSMASTFAGTGVDVTVVDPYALSKSELRRAIRGGSGPVVWVYPSIDSTDRIDLALIAAVLAVERLHRPVRFHFHEFSNQRRRLRYQLVAALAAVGDRVVTSARSEQRAVASVLRQMGRRRVDVIVAPPTNGTAPSPSDLKDSLSVPASSRFDTVGVFGSRRDDKALEDLVDAIADLPSEITRIEFVGHGWSSDLADASRWAAVEIHGHVPTDRLPVILGRWGTAIAPFSWPAHDGRMSLRTVLAHGIPTRSTGPFDEDLTLRPPHLHQLDEPHPAPAVDRVERAALAEVVTDFESVARARLLDALLSAT